MRISLGIFLCLRKLLTSVIWVLNFSASSPDFVTTLPIEPKIQPKTPHANNIKHIVTIFSFAVTGFISP